jgi:DNA modification methylase
MTITQKSIPPQILLNQDKLVDHIWFLNRLLTEDLMDQLSINPDLNRRLVSFQGNKSTNGHRWYSYKEGFSSELVNYCIDKLHMIGPILDPFAGSGTTLFTASNLGIDSIGIDMLPNSIETIKVRQLIRSTNQNDLITGLHDFISQKVWESEGQLLPVNSIRITHGAFPEETIKSLSRYLFEVSQISSEPVQQTLRFAAMCILEQISYTRKDGQYLRWDSRSGRKTQGKPFIKTNILGFTEAITKKTNEIVEDIQQERRTQNQGRIVLESGSCIDILPKIEHDSINGIITSPPYCNRYDYTRTYALEIAFLGTTEEKIKALRQSLLSCTVENREKSNIRNTFRKDSLTKGLFAFNSQELVQEIVHYLEVSRELKLLNNSGIVRMVQNYFLELSLVISDCFRILKPNAPFVMVNDNVQYQGISIPVDLILSDIAKRIGFSVDKIWILPSGKGNSSQQMGKYGRHELRKCVYVWRKPYK